MTTWEDVNPGNTDQVGNALKSDFSTCGTAWALGSASLDGLWEQPEGFTASITFPSPGPWWDTHHSGVGVCYHPFWTPFKMN